MNTGKGDALYTTAEIMLATGLGRGTITNRALRLGYERNGKGYTVDQVIQIITVPLQIHRKSEAAAMELREKLNERFQKDDISMAIVRLDGDWKLEYRNGKQKTYGKRG